MSSAHAVNTAADTIRAHVPMYMGRLSSVHCSCGTELDNLDEWAGHVTVMLSREGVLS